MVEPAPYEHTAPLRKDDKNVQQGQVMIFGEMDSATARRER
jgi:hypothetical protein